MLPDVNWIVLRSTRISYCSNRRELSSLRQTVLEERSAVDGFVAGLMEAVAEGGKGIGAEVDRVRAEDAERLAKLRGQLEAKAVAAKALEREVEECRRQVAASEEALSELRRALVILTLFLLHHRWRHRKLYCISY